MADFPLKVKRRYSATGQVVEILCDTAEHAKEVAKDFRDLGHTDVWIEDASGVPVPER